MSDGDERGRGVDAAAAASTCRRGASRSLSRPAMYWPGRHAADRPGQHVVEQQRRDRQLRQRAAHRLLDDAVDAAAHEHRRALDVERPDGVGEEHHAEDEPGRGLADGLLGDAADVEGGRARGRSSTMAAARQNEMKERKTVVATTTRTRASPDGDGEVVHEAFRVTPAGLADGLGLGSVLWPDTADSPRFSGPPRPASGAVLRLF